MTTSGDTDLDEVAAALESAADRVAEVLAGTDDWAMSGGPRGPYRVDVEADAVAVPLLLDAGLGVLSEESGRHAPERPLTAVIDPLDGTTNASRGIPWFATSICVVDDSGPLIALVVDQVHGHRFRARRGHGATRDGQPIAPATDVPMDQAIIGLSDLAPAHLGWGQYRTLGAVALDLCAVADGRLDGYIDCGVDAHGSWDYLSGGRGRRGGRARAGPGHPRARRSPDTSGRVDAGPAPCLPGRSGHLRLTAGSNL